MPSENFRGHFYIKFPDFLFFKGDLSPNEMAFAIYNRARTKYKGLYY